MSNTLFIHLSDIHLEENTPINRYAHLICNSLSSYYLEDVKTIFLVFSGDMTKSAKKAQFETFDKFICKIRRELSNISDVRPHVMIVPGNHDITLEGRILPFMQKSAYTKSEIQALLENEIANMDLANELCKKYGCFKSNKIISVNELETETIKYRFILVNTAPFSTLEKRDKGHHYINAEELGQIPTNVMFGKKTVNILVMHHRPDWFDEEASLILNKYISEHVGLAFFGHEHDPKYKLVENSGKKTICDHGGVLIPKSKKDSKDDGCFSFSLLDESTGKIKRIEATINPQSNTFSNKENSVYNVRTEEILPIKEDFKNGFYRSPLTKEQGSLLDVFVMPSITNNKDNFELSSIDKLMERIKKDKLFVIEGSNKSGKTTLLKALFNEFQKIGPCIFLKITSSTNDNAKKLIKDSFESIYGDEKEKFDLYSGFEMSKKILFVDNFEIIENPEYKRKMLEYFKENFGAVVISYSKNDMPLQAVKELGLFDPEKVYRNYGITAKGRKQLVERICRLKNVDEDQIDLISNFFEREINGVNIYDFTDPSQGLVLLEAIIDQKLYLERNTNKAFTETFMHYIDGLLIKNNNPDYLDSLKIILSTLAFNLWKNKSSIVFTESDMINAFAFCKKEKRCTIEFSVFSKIVLQSGIIYSCGNSTYRFKKNSFYSYFISQEIMRLSNEEDTEEYFNELVNNVAHGLNSDILLFIFFTIKRIKPIKIIAENLEEKYKDIQLLDFNDPSNYIFANDVSLLEEDKANMVSKKQQLDKKDMREKELSAKASESEIRQAENKDLSDSNSLIESIKSIEIISKAIAGFETLIKEETREKLFNIAYTSLLKIISAAFSFKNDDLEQLEKEYGEYKDKKILELAINKGKNEKEIQNLEKSSVKNFLFGLFVETLTLYESIFAYLVSSKQTIGFISELPSNKFENCIFKLYCYIFMQKFDKFINELKYAKDNFNPNKINNLVSFFARIYIVHNSFTNEQFDKICSIAGLKKTALLPYAAKEEKII